MNFLRKVGGNVGKALKKTNKDAFRQVVRSGRDVAAAADSKLGKIAIGAAVGLGTFGIGTAAAIGIAAGAAKRGGGLKSAIRGGLEGAAAGAGGKVIAKGLGGFRQAILKKQDWTATIADESQRLIGSGDLRKVEPMPERVAIVNEPDLPAWAVPDVVRRPMQEPAPAIRAQRESMLNANREGANVEDLTTVAPAAALAPSLQMAEISPTNYEGSFKKYLPAIAAVLLLLALVFMRSKGAKAA